MKSLTLSVALLLAMPSILWAELQVSTNVDFEQYNTLDPIGTVAGTGITFDANWLAIEGFPGRPAGEDTVAFLGGALGDTGEISLSNPIQKASLIYSSAVAVTLTAFDAGGAVVAIASGPANGVGTFSPIQVEASGTTITRLELVGGNNATAIDDFTITGSSDDPVELLECLIMQIAEINFARGIDNALDAKLDSILRAIEDLNENNDVSACNRLETFVIFVEAQESVGRLTEEQTTFMVEAANQISATFCTE